MCTWPFVLHMYYMCSNICNLANKKSAAAPVTRLAVLGLTRAKKTLGCPCLASFPCSSSVDIGSWRRLAPVQWAPITKEEEGEAGFVNRFPGLFMPQMRA